jgi:hypothetical protein
MNPITIKNLFGIKTMEMTHILYLLGNCENPAIIKDKYAAIDQAISLLQELRDQELKDIGLS